MALFPLLAAGVAGTLAVGCFRRGRRVRGGAMRVWGLALAQFALASGLLAWGVALGWSPGLYRAYYLLGAVLNVLWLGLGTAWLPGSRALSWGATATALAATAYAVVVVGGEELMPAAAEALATQEIPRGAVVMPSGARALSRWYSIAGSVVVVAGLGWSAVARREKALGLLLLTAGVVVVAGASELARLGHVAPFSIGLAAGVVVMYLGFRRT